MTLSCDSCDSCHGAAARPQVGLCLCVAVYFGLLLTGLVPDRVSLAVALSLPIVSCVASVTGAPCLRDRVSWTHAHGERHRTCYRTGALLPISCVHFDLDPAVIAAPLMTTIVDCAGIAAYLSVSGFILGSGAPPQEGAQPCGHAAAATAAAGDARGAISLGAAHAIAGVATIIVACWADL